MHSRVETALESDATAQFDARDPVVVRGLTAAEHVALRRAELKRTLCEVRR